MSRNFDFKAIIKKSFVGGIIVLLLLALGFILAVVLYRQDSGAQKPTSSNSIDAPGQILIVNDIKHASPTLVFISELSDQALSEKLLSDLKYCGWFNVLDSGSAAYHVSAKGTLQDYTVTVSNGAGVAMHSFRITDSRETDAAAHTAVDTVLNKLFGIQGICRSKIAFSATTDDRNREIFMCDFDGSNIKQITKNNTLSVEPVWVSDGDSIIYNYHGADSSNLMQYDLKTSLSRKLTQNGGINSSGALSPDGNTLAFILARNNQIDLYIRPTEGGPLKQLTNSKGIEASPRWNPDGTKLSFVSEAQDERPVLCVIAPFEGGNAVEISGLVGSERVEPSWSADNKLAYCAKVGGAYELRIAKLSSDGKSGVMEGIGVGDNNTFQGEAPSWAPDNRHVALTMSDGIYVIDTWLGKKRRLVSGSGWIGQSNWSPVLNPSYDVYEVQRGATLSAIAKAYDVTVDDIRKANNLNGGMLQPGQRLIIPKKSADIIEPPEEPQ